MSSIKTVFVVLLALVAVCLSNASPAMAQPVEVSVQTIYASEEAEGINKALAPLKEALKTAFPPSYRYFELIERQVLSLAPGETRQITLPDQDRTELQISYLALTDEDLVEIKLVLKDAARTKVDTALKLTPGATFFQAGLVYQEGILVIAIRADLSGTDHKPAPPEPPE